MRSPRYHARCAKRAGSRKSFFESTGAQTKLHDGAETDVYEQQANAAERRITETGADTAFFKPLPGAIQKKGGLEQAGENATANNVGGQSLDSATRNFMEPKFGYDFSNVKIHNDSAAHKSASNINALAYTHGNNIVFGEGQYQPHTPAGKQLLAHELTHVVQQQGQATAVQRKKNNEKEDKASVMFDNDVDDFKRNYHLKIIFKGLVEGQKAPIIATKDGEVIGVTLGPAYAGEADENARKAWIKAEIIGKFVSSDRYQDLAYDPTHEKLNELNPPYIAGKYCALNCPATAAALADYLKTGTINKAYCNPLLEDKGKGYGFDVSMNKISDPLSWKQAEATIRKQLKKHVDFVVVEAKRSAEQMKKLNITDLHYFTVVNVKGTLIAIDAFGGGIVISDLQDFID